MARFQFDKSLKSYRIDKGLIASIEDYSRQELMKMVGLPTEEFQKHFSISITDDLGTETISSIADYRPALFPNSVSGIRISFDSGWKTSERVELSLAFGRSRSGSRISVRFDGDNPRSKVVAVYDSIIRLLDPRRTSNSFFDPGFMSVPLGVITMMCVGFGISAWNSRHGVLSWSLLIVASAGVLYWLAGRLNPYATFDSPSDRSREELWRWLKFGFLGFLVFETIMMALRKRVFGF